MISYGRWIGIGFACDASDRDVFQSFDLAKHMLAGVEKLQRGWIGRREHCVTRDQENASDNCLTCIAFMVGYRQWADCFVQRFLTIDPASFFERCVLSTHFSTGRRAMFVDWC